MTNHLRISQDELYRQARLVINRKIDYWAEKDKPALFTAFKVFQQLAAENYGKAYYPLAVLYEGKRDIQEGQNRMLHFSQLAFDWCNANQANQDAELWGDLGEMYLYGHGVEENLEQSAYWFRKAAEHGYAEAQNNLAHSYSFGIGVPRDDKEAVKWYRLAAEQGHAIAQSNLGFLFENGNGVPRNYDEANKWHRLAAAQDDADVHEALGKLGLYSYMLKT